ncbi:MAG: radical SAM protein [Eubacteriales bacterium]|nr:radical SAM protein [Eubacteriales bacterium]
MEQISGCRLCPRECGADRAAGERGFCGVFGEYIYVARAGLHMWEEPCISGNKGSGTVFFCGCPLGCVYCQNYQISGPAVKRTGVLKTCSGPDTPGSAEPDTSESAGLAALKPGKAISTERLAEVFLNLQEKGAANINLVTPTHYTPQIIEATGKARSAGLRIPLVYNCGGYEKPETLKTLEGIVDIYLTDFKYMEADIAQKYSRAKDYPEKARAALKEMVRQQPKPVFDGEEMMKKGVIVRHLLLPNHVKNAKAVVRYLYETYGNQIYVSLMNQYTPLPQAEKYPELNRKVTKREYERLLDYAISLGMENVFIQEGETAKESFIPAFDGSGV